MAAWPWFTTQLWFSHHTSSDFRIRSGERASVLLMVQIVASQLSWEPAVSNGRHQILKWSTFTWIAQLRKIVPPLPLRSNQALKWAWERSNSRQSFKTPKSNYRQANRTQVSLSEIHFKKKIVPPLTQVSPEFKKKLFPLLEIWNWSRAEKAIIGCHQSDSKWIFRPGHQGCVRGIVKKREGRKCLRGRKAFSSWPARDWRRRRPFGIRLIMGLQSK